MHKGCDCKTSCDTNTCPCLASGRECDPDKCRGCAATARLQGARGRLELNPPERTCHNMNLRLRVRRRVAMGLSLVAGWGCFIMEDVPKGAFIVRADLCSPGGVPVFMPPRTKSVLARVNVVDWVVARLIS